MSQSLVTRSASEKTHPTARCAFTLFEVLMVAIIVTVMAATIIPQFSPSTTDAKLSSRKFNLHSIRCQLEKYKEQHLGYYPPARTNREFVEQMTHKTDQSTMLNSNGAWGPYLEGGIPANPFNGSATVAIIGGAVPPTNITGSSDGWQYNPAQGWFYPNDPDFFCCAVHKN